VAGKTTMFVDAQNANRDFLAAQRRGILARHGLESSETGTIRAVDVEAAEREDDARRAFETKQDSGDTLLGAQGGLTPEELPDPPDPRTPPGA